SDLKSDVPKGPWVRIPPSPYRGFNIFYMRGDIGSFIAGIMPLLFLGWLAAIEMGTRWPRRK
ncbi:MAG: hypothetical protein ACFCVB_19185, partial [Nodosilinea sp.]